MTQRLSDLLGDFIGDEEREMEHAGTAELKAIQRLRSIVGDRQSRDLALNIAMAPVYNQLRPNFNITPPSSPPSRSPTATPRILLKQATESALAIKSQQKDSPKKAWDSLFLQPKEEGSLVLSPAEKVVNPRISVTTDYDMKNFELVKITQNDKQVLSSTTLSSLSQGTVFRGVVDKSHPIKITMRSVGPRKNSIQGHLAP
jgi:hypothetical protein